MEQYKQEFIEFMVESDVLKFGDFTLKSGRKSPFFMNAGAYVTGSQLAKLGEYYAKAIHETYGMTLMCCLGLHIREFLSALLRRWLMRSFMARKCVIAQTARKRKIMEQIREAFLEVS